MRQWTGAPAVPRSYPRLSALSPQELAEAVHHGYVADAVDPAAPVDRAGGDSHLMGVHEDDVRDWRARMYAIWFCYVFENFTLLHAPMTAVEELFLEFKSDVLESPEISQHQPWRRLASLYAGCGGLDPLAVEKRPHAQANLRPWYDTAVRLIDDWLAGNHDGDRPRLAP